MPLQKNLDLNRDPQWWLMIEVIQRMSSTPLRAAVGSSSAGTHTEHRVNDRNMMFKEWDECAICCRNRSAADRRTDINYTGSHPSHGSREEADNHHHEQHPVHEHSKQQPRAAGTAAFSLKHALQCWNELTVTEPSHVEGIPLSLSSVKGYS